ncbi:MAG: signal peptidase I [Rhodobacteraceae bacterium]|nr:signal peptidase I [Paracoccaceae bacterium]
METVKTVFYALLIAGAIRTLIFQPFWIPTSSMKSTLFIGDFLFVNKFAYGFSYASCPSMFGVDFCGFAKGSETRLMGSEPERGDVVVFKHPTLGSDYIKRLIGLPGDRIKMVEGLLYINGAAVAITPNEPFTEIKAPQGPQRGQPRCTNNPAPGGLCEKESFTEVLPNGVSYSILNIQDSGADNMAEITVPENTFFFMGDNRDNSIDSRYPQTGPQGGGVGFVPRENLIGRADRIIFSSAGSSLFSFWTWRSDRYFKAIE